jgi:hypothetical protein
MLRVVFLARMHAIILMIAGLPLLFVACSSPRNVTANPESVTDYVVGQTYRLKQPVLLSGKVLEPFPNRESEERSRMIPGRKRRIHEPGTLLVVRRVEVARARAPKQGTWIEVYAELLAAELPANKNPMVKAAVQPLPTQGLVLISEISLRTPPAFTKRNPEMLEPTERQSQ